MRNKYIVLPPLNSNGICYQFPYFAFCQLVCEIPHGQIATFSSIMTCLEKAYGRGTLELERSLQDTMAKADEKYPYWRIVSDRGHLLQFCGKETQKGKLEQEGHIIFMPDPKKDMYIIKDYKKKLFDFDSLHISIMERLQDMFPILKEISTE